MSNRDSLVNCLVRHCLEIDEGVRQAPYRDSLGLWTIGIGHLIGEDFRTWKISQSVINALFLGDISEAKQICHRIYGAHFFENDLDEIRQVALLNLAFNLGNRLEGFKKANQAIMAKDWERAADEFLDSKWAKQVKSRSDRVAHCIRFGVLHDTYQRMFDKS
jgi:lysozyme